LEECFELADEMFVLREGRIVQSGPPSAVCAKPATLETARLLGNYNILPVEIRALDPGRRTSILRVAEEHDIEAEYYPGHFKGDRVHLLTTPRQLRAEPRTSRRIAMNSVPLELERTADTPDGVRLEFIGGLQVEIPRAEYSQAREWDVIFPSTGLRIL
jgi:ABC-type Fe3+/spermidine/putrescine transport system ATPase subunit